MTFLWWPAIPVYLAIAYLMIEVTTDKNAFFVGAATYAIYDFTNLAMFKNYSPYFAVADSLWGGILFASVRSILNYIDYTLK